MTLDDVLTCTRCSARIERPGTLAKSSFANCPYVCQNCRCKDCSIVLGFECDCGERHAERDSTNPAICQKCAIIRVRVSYLEPELLKLRNSEIAKEVRIDEYPAKVEEPSQELSSPLDLQTDSIQTDSTINKGEYIN